MKTIEERAKEYCKNQWDAPTAMTAYMDGATEQKAIDKAIDIEKACKWFADYLMEIGYLDDWMKNSSNMLSGEERFRKAMEE